MNAEVDAKIEDRQVITKEPEQIPLAFIRGEAVLEQPEDLFIPPEALEVILEAFEGPLDLLLYLIRKQKFDILDLPINQITAQYMEYVEIMKDLNLELAAEYLVMAAILAEIKSRLLLPKIKVDEGEDEDPRAELIRRLQEYEVFKKAAENLDEVPRDERDFYHEPIDIAENCQPKIILPDVDLQELVSAFSQVLKRVDNFKHHQISAEVLSTRERMTKILEQLEGDTFLPFSTFFDFSEGKQGVVVTFLAILELAKEKLIQIQQNLALADIHIRRAPLLESSE
ncbi:segregation/condensation protein A [Catenovulum sp. SM1970]|uniref:segregation and condensation protein A n=1 Tax=Marinifaba aquimaris TaxID=2741323 RepID=UPI001572F718|nr:segregation/condensation protein A [Marinifaba aquimaris]NTS76130.1 segregation/condensation protein A [Marinifaba aquimaris]